MLWDVWVRVHPNETFAVLVMLRISFVVLADDEAVIGIPYLERGKLNGSCPVLRGCKLVQPARYVLNQATMRSSASFAAASS